MRKFATGFRIADSNFKKAEAVAQTNADEMKRDDGFFPCEDPAVLQWDVAVFARWLITFLASAYLQPPTIKPTVSFRFPPRRIPSKRTRCEN